MAKPGRTWDFLILFYMGFYLIMTLATILKISVQMHSPYSYSWCINWQHICNCMIYVLIFSVMQLCCDVEACCQSVYMPWKVYKIFRENFDVVKMCADNRMISGHCSKILILLNVLPSHLTTLYYLYQKCYIFQSFSQTNHT